LPDYFIYSLSHVASNHHKYRIQRENYIESVTQAAGKAAAAKAIQEVYLYYNDEDEDEYSDYSTDAP
jgi:hypothetical protein